MIKIARITVNPYKLEEYKAILKEEMETSLRLDDGVQVLYATWDNENPNRFTILEKYESEEAYISHCASPQLQKYFELTNEMVLSLEITDATPVIENIWMK